MKRRFFLRLPTLLLPSVLGVKKLVGLHPFRQSTPTSTALGELMATELYNHMQRKSVVRRYLERTSA